MTITETQDLVKVWEDKNNIDHNQLSNVTLLGETVSELTRTLAKTYGKTQISDKERLNIEKNIGEIVWRALSIANQNQVNTCEAIIATLEKKNRQ